MIGLAFWIALWLIVISGGLFVLCVLICVVKELSRLEVHSYNPARDRREAEAARLATRKAADAARALAPPFDAG